MTVGRPTIERRLLTALNATPGRIPVLLGGCGSGRTSLLLRLGKILSDTHSQYIDAERIVSTPEGFYQTVTANSPYIVSGLTHPTREQRAAKAAFDALLNFFQEARAKDGTSSAFLIDEVLELRTFESFPGLRGILRELLDTLASSPNKFVLSTRYTNRAHRLFRDAPERFEVIHIPPLSSNEVSATLLAHGVGRDDAERNDLGRMIRALTDGRPVYVQALARELASMDGASSGDPVSALASQLSVDSHLWLICRFCYELRLHRARGYGALKAILQVLGEEEPLTLTEIARELGRTPGSTKDYLSWLEDVDLVRVRQKRYSYCDPMLRLWVRLHCKSTPPNEADLSREVQEYAVSRLPYMEQELQTANFSNQQNNEQSKETPKPVSVIKID